MSTYKEPELKERINELEDVLFHICEIFHNKQYRDLIPSDDVDDVFIIQIKIVPKK